VLLLCNYFLFHYLCINFFRWCDIFDVSYHVAVRKHFLATHLDLSFFLIVFYHFSFQSLLRILQVAPMNWVTAFCSNNASPALSLLAQDSMLKHFLKRSTFEVKASVNHELNYVVFERSKQFPTAHLRKSPLEKERTLVLMHGFGLGLGFFYGIVMLVCFSRLISPGVALFLLLVVSSCCFLYCR
jgi:hypothetical protein